MFGNPDTAGGPGLEPSHAGSVKAAYVYDHGFCSRQESLAALAKEQFGNVQEELADLLGASGSQIEWLRLASYLEHDDRDPLDLHGGFFLNANVNLEAGPATLGLKAVAKYRFSLEADGGLQIDPPDVLYASPLICDFDGDCFYPVVFVLNQIATTANESIGPQQHIDIFGQSGFAQSDCDPRVDLASADGCANQMALASSLAYDGAAALGLTSDVADVGADAVKDTMNDPQNWSCREVTDPSAGTTEGHNRCHFFLPGKRLNAYPDAVELVWFDGENAADWEATETGNPAFALYALASAPLIQNLVAAGQFDDPRAMMCTYQPDPHNSQGHRAWVSLAEDPSVVAQ